MMTTSIKSIKPVRLYGNGNNGNWAARARTTDGSESFSGICAGYTLAQAIAVINAYNPLLVGFDTLPAGVTVK